jgi:hypothetical protein
MRHFAATIVELPAMDKSLSVIEQKTVDFYNDELTAVRANDGQVYVSVRHMCDALGIQRPQRQTDRIKRDEVLNNGLQRVPIMGTRGAQNTYVLRVDLVPLWLTGLETSRIDEDVRDKIIRYKREAAKVLWEAFQEGRLTTDQSFSDLLEANSPAAQAYKLARAMMELARNQLLLESRLDTHDKRLGEYERRLEDVEATLGDTDRFVTPDQASQISQAVKTVALKLGKKTGRNEYGAVYGELYRKFGVTGYKQLPASKFQQAMNWLNEWRENIEEGLPF